MATNIEMNILKADGNYDTLYPKTLGSLVNGAVASATNATTATKLQTGRTIRTNLGSANSATFDGSSDIIPGITGTLSTSYGGTSANSAPGGLYNLIVGCSTRTASQVNNYASSTYLGAYYNTTGYRIAISNLLTYFQNNLSTNSLSIYETIYVGNGAESRQIVSLPRKPYAVSVGSYYKMGYGNTDVITAVGMIPKSAILGNNNYNEKTWLTYNYGKTTQGNTVDGLIYFNSYNGYLCIGSYLNKNGNNYFIVAFY